MNDIVSLLVFVGFIFGWWCVLGPLGIMIGWTVVAVLALLSKKN